MDLEIHDEYEENLKVVKQILKGMVAVEEGAYYFGNYFEVGMKKMRWKSKFMEIQIKEIPESETLIIKVFVHLAKTKKRKNFLPDPARYFYTIEKEKTIKREFSPAPGFETIVDYGKSPLNELAFILTTMVMGG